MKSSSLAWTGPLSTAIGWPSSAVKRPAFRSVFWDHRGWHYGGKGDVPANWTKSKVCMLFFDSHVETIPYSEFVSGKDRGFWTDFRN